jgi:hypothetical protein
MGKERYTFTIDKKVVEETKKKLKKYGGKLSGLINNLLIKWNKENK